MENIATFDPKKLVFLDETGSNISMTRTHGRSRRGNRVYGVVPRNRGKVLTVIGAIGVEGMRAHMEVEGGTTGEVFLTYVRDHLVPSLHPRDVVVMDNLGAHHATGVREAIESAGASVVYLPPYSCDLNPIELAWSKLKAALRRIGARTVARLREAVINAFGTLQPSDSLGWFRHCGLDE
jgi:transposase